MAALGALLEATWHHGDPLGAPWGPLVGLLGASWEALGASWEPLGASWEPLGDHLGTLWGPFGASLGLLRLLESCLDGLGSHLGAKKAPKKYPKSTPEAPKITFGVHHNFNGLLHALFHCFGVILS